jgi:hypothetical protein
MNSPSVAIVLLLHVDEHHRQRTQTTLADLVASTLTSAEQ